MITPILTIICIMNLLTKYSGLILLSALFLSACEDPGKIGLEVQPTDDPVGVMYADTFSITTEVTQRGERIPTSEGNRLFAGGYTDPVFGKLKTEGYFQFIPQNSSFRFPEQSTYESMTFSFGLTYAYGDTNTQQTLNLHTLAAPLQSGIFYYADSSVTYNPEVEGTNTIPANILSEKTDTAVVLTTEALGRRIFDAAKADTAFFDNNFKTSFPGLALTGTSAEEFNAAFGFNLASSKTIAKLYYRKPSGDSTLRDSISFLLHTGAKAVSFSHISADRSGTVLAPVGNQNKVPSSQLDNKGYVQGGTGISTIIRFPDLEKLQEKEKISITRAELVITPVEINGLVPPSRLTLSELDSNGDVLTVTGRGEAFILDGNAYIDGRSQDLIYSFPYKASTNSYKINISQYINDIINGIKPNNGLILSATPMNGTLNRLIFTTQQGQPNTLKLKIYYVPSNH